MKRRATAEEKRHMDKVSAMGCIVCELARNAPGTPAQVHHCRVRHGWGRSGHIAVIPLCDYDHNQYTGIHSMGREQFKDKYGYSENELLDIVNERLRGAA